MQPTIDTLLLLEEELLMNLDNINKLIVEVNAIAQRMSMEAWNDGDIKPHQVRASSGELMLAPLVKAKAENIHAMVMIQQMKKEL